MSNPWSLPPRQAQVLSLLAEVGCNKLIARKLGLDPRTVETHVARALKKMGLANRTQAAVAWDRWARDGAQ